MQIIYATIDPRDGKEFYIGRTEDIYRRFKQHLNCEGRNDTKNARIRELQSLHLVPIMKTLEIIEDAALAAQRESYWIRHFRYLGHALSNDTIFSPPIDEEDPIAPAGVIVRKKTKREVLKGSAAAQIQRVLKTNPNIPTSDVANRLNVTPQYVRRIRIQMLQEINEFN